MNRTWRTATAGLAASALLLTIGASAATAQSADDLTDALSPITDAVEDLVGGGLPGEDGEGDGTGDTDGDDADADATATEGDAGAIPETGMGGFAGYARASGATVCVGLPQALADGLEPVLDALGLPNSCSVPGFEGPGLQIDLAQVEADLERAAAGEEISSEARAFITNLLLASGAADEPGNCSGAPQSLELPPDEDVPLLTLTIAGVDCEETDERAFADVEIVGLDIRLGALIELGLPAEVRDGIQDALDALNESLLANANELLCPVVDGIGLTIGNCDAGEPILQLANPLDLDVPLVNLDAVQATAEVVQDGDSITATATSSLAGLNAIGVACADTGSLSTATSDGETASREAQVDPLTGATCNTDQQLFQLLLGDGPLGDIGVFDSILQNELLDGSLEPLFDGLDEILAALTTQALTSGQAVLGPIEGAGTTAATTPNVVATSVPFDAIEPLEPLGEISVVVVTGETEVGVNAVPAGAPVVPASPSDPTDPTTPSQLPRTGAGAGALLGLAALGAAAAMRRRED